MTWVPDLSGNGTIDKPYKHFNRKVITTPVNVLVPEYAGERVLDGVVGVQWQALGRTQDTWVDCGVGGPE
jgi:hypothetical protein